MDLDNLLIGKYTEMKIKKPLLLDIKKPIKDGF